MDLVKDLDTPSLWWLSGYVAGLAQSQLTSTLTAVPEEDSGTQAKQRLLRALRQPDRQRTAHC